jgi:DNA invertase Pin-like site-specific DNA recombinase
MLAKEVQSIARSITKWTSRHMSADGLREWHQKQNKKSVKVRRAKANNKADEIKAFKTDHAELSNRKIAAALGIPESTVRRLLKE